MEKKDTVTAAIYRLAATIMDPNVEFGKDAAGGIVTCVTEALMGHTAGLVMVADAINNLAEAVREMKE